MYYRSLRMGALPTVIALLVLFVLLSSRLPINSRHASPSESGDPAGPRAWSPDDVFWDDRFGPPELSSDPIRFAVDTTTGTLVVGGAFTHAGGQEVNHVSRWDGAQWLPFGSGFDDIVSAVAVDTSGIVFAGGDFTESDGNPVRGLARWTGTDWEELEGGVVGYINALMVGPANEIFVGGGLTEIGLLPADNIAMWTSDGGWDYMGDGTNGVVHDLTLLPDSTLIVAGFFTEAGGSPCEDIATWKDGMWGCLGPVPSAYFSEPRHLAVDSVGRLYVSSLIGGSSIEGITVLDGGTWTSLGGGMPYQGAHQLAVDGADNLYVAYNLPVLGKSPVAVWHPATSTWSDLPGSPVEISLYASPIAYDLASQTLYVGGSFAPSLDIGTTAIAYYRDASWHAMGGDGVQGSIYDMDVDGNGSVHIVGNFDHAGPVESPDGVSQWAPNAWISETDNPAGFLAGQAFDADGNRYVFGSFDDGSLHNIAKFDGSTWDDMDSGTEGFTDQVAIDTLNDLVYVSGEFETAGAYPAKHISVWDGIDWGLLGTGIDDFVYAMDVDPCGNLFVGGDFTSAGGVTASRIAKWDGSSWHALAAGGMTGVSGDVHAIETVGCDRVYIGGDFQNAGGVSAGHVAFWNGSEWSALGTGLWGSGQRLVRTLYHDPTTGLLYAGGSFTTAGGASASRIAAWNGYYWMPLGSGISVAGDSEAGAVNFIVPGSLFISGSFDQAGGKPSLNVARFDNSLLPLVEIALAASQSDGNVILNWSPGATSGYAEVGIEHHTVSGASNTNWVPFGARTSARNSSIVIEGFPYGKHQVRLVLFSADGSVDFSESIEIESRVPGGVRFEEAYPNPFRTSTSVMFSVRESQRTSARLFDVRGRLVRTVYDSEVPEDGTVELSIDGTDLTSGLYLLQVAGRTFEKTISLVKVN